MKLTTIWTIPAMTLRERLRRTGDEWFLRELAHRLPRRLAYWSLIDTGVRYMRDDIATDVTFFTVLERFSRDAEKH